MLGKIIECSRMSEKRACLSDKYLVEGKFLWQDEKTQKMNTSSYRSTSCAWDVPVIRKQIQLTLFIEFEDCTTGTGVLTCKVTHFSFVNVKSSTFQTKSSYTKVLLG